LASALVIRFGSLGDLCLLAWSLSRLARGEEGPPRHQVTLVTKAAYADLLSNVPGVDEVVPLGGSRPADMTALARTLGGRRFDHVIDAHGNLRSRLLLARLGRRPHARLAKDTWARLALLLWRQRPAALERTMRDRYDLLVQDLLSGPGEAGPTPAPFSPPLRRLIPTDPGRGPVLGLAPGARWTAKRWPDSHFADFLDRFRRISAAPVRIFLGPQERSWFTGSALERRSGSLAEVSLWQGKDLTATAAGLAGCTTLLTNDSGLMHLAEAVGTPVLALFGPTVREFGFFPVLPRSQVLQRDLACRPCSRHGKRACWRRDLACLERISPPEVLAALLTMPAGPNCRTWEDSLA